jgi:hypothetical protein
VLDCLLIAAVSLLAVACVFEEPETTTIDENAAANSATSVHGRARLTEDSVQLTSNRHSCSGLFLGLAQQGPKELYHCSATVTLGSPINQVVQNSDCALLGLLLGKNALPDCIWTFKALKSKAVNNNLYLWFPPK